MSVIGENIKKYRIESGITQEQLGELIGVTTQAVSRWERGGTPDTEMLPILSDVLGVSIDALFSREEQEFNHTLARRLSAMPADEAYSYAFSICWAVAIGLLSDKTSFDDFLKKLLERSVVTEDKKKSYYAKLISDSGMLDLRMSPDLNYFFFLTEPKTCISEQLSDLDSLRSIFELFADEKMLTIIFYIYSIPDMPLSASLISKKTGIDIKETERCMDILCEHNLASLWVVSTADGDIRSYRIRPESFAVPLLCFADETARNDSQPFVGKFTRTKRLL